MSAQTSFDARSRRGFCFFLLMALDPATVLEQIGCSLDLLSFGSPNIIQRSVDKCDQTALLVLGFYSWLYCHSLGIVTSFQLSLFGILYLAIALGMRLPLRISVSSRKSNTDDLIKFEIPLGAPMQANVSLWAI